MIKSSKNFKPMLFILVFFRVLIVSADSNSFTPIMCDNCSPKSVLTVEPYSSSVQSNSRRDQYTGPVMNAALNENGFHKSYSPFRMSSENSVMNVDINDKKSYKSNSPILRLPEGSVGSVRTVDSNEKKYQNWNSHTFGIPEGSVGSVMSADLNEKDFQKPHTPFLGLSGGYKVMTTPVVTKYGSGSSKYMYLPKQYRKNGFRDRNHPTTFEARPPPPPPPPPLQNSFEGAGEVLQPLPGEVEPEILQSAPSETELFQDSSGVLQTQNGFGFGGGYGYPYPGYQPNLPDITEPPFVGKQSDLVYGYYYIGRKLWYIPLYFSIYFIIYVGALILKAIAKHKIYFPSNLAAAVTSKRSLNQSEQNQLTATILSALENFNS